MVHSVTRWEVFTGLWFIPFFFSTRLGIKTHLTEQARPSHIFFKACKPPYFPFLTSNTFPFSRSSRFALNLSLILPRSHHPLTSPLSHSQVRFSYDTRSNKPLYLILLRQGIYYYFFFIIIIFFIVYLFVYFLTAIFFSMQANTFCFLVCLCLATFFKLVSYKNTRPTYLALLHLKFPTEIWFYEKKTDNQLKIPIAECLSYILKKNCFLMSYATCDSGLKKSDELLL